MLANLSPQKIGPLDCLVLPGQPQGKTAVIFHGYGANYGDLVGLANELGFPKGTRFIFPNGLLSIPYSAAYEGRAWFHIDWEMLERNVAGLAPDYEERRPAGLDESVLAVQSMLAELNCPLDQLVLGGFSQGAMLSLEVALSLPQQLAGVLLFSVGLIDRSTWACKMARLGGTRFFQSHGTHDPILPFDQAKTVYSLLVDAGWQGPFCSFSGGHEIPGRCLAEARQTIHAWSHEP